MSDAQFKSDRKGDVEIAEVELHEKERSNSVHGPVDIDDGYTQEQIRAATRRVDRRLIPVLSLLYCISFIDRTNLSLARAANGQIMNQELDLLGGNNRYGIATLIFFVPYIIFEIPVSVLCLGMDLGTWFHRIPRPAAGIADVSSPPTSRSLPLKLQR